MSIKQKVVFIAILSIALVGFFGKTTHAADATWSSSGNISYHGGVYARIYVPTDENFKKSACGSSKDVYIKASSSEVGVICFLGSDATTGEKATYVRFYKATYDPDTGSVTYNDAGTNGSGGQTGSGRNITLAPSSGSGTTSGDISNSNGSTSNTTTPSSTTPTGDSTGSDVAQAPSYSDDDRQKLEAAADCTESAEVKCCGKVKTSILNFVCKDGEDPITTILYIVLQVLTAAIGIAAVGGIGYGALLYTTAQNSPEQTKRAISIITNVVIGIVAYALMYVLLNFLVPGGVFASS